MHVPTSLYEVKLLMLLSHCECMCLQVCTKLNCSWSCHSANACAYEFVRSETAHGLVTVRMHVPTSLYEVKLVMVLSQCECMCLRVYTKLNCSWPCHSANACAFEFVRSQTAHGPGTVRMHVPTSLYEVKLLTVLSQCEFMCLRICTK